MTDKEKLDAIRAEIHRLVDVRGYDREMANDLFTFMDSLPNEPVSKNLEEVQEEPKLQFKVGDTIRSKVWELAVHEIVSMDDSAYYFENGGMVRFDDQEQWELAEEPISEDLEKVAEEAAVVAFFVSPQWTKTGERLFKAGALWQKQQDSKLSKVWDRETLDEYAYQVAYDLSNDWMRETPTWDDVETAVRLGAKWQKEHLWKPADGDDLPAIDKEVIVLTQKYPLKGSEYAVSFAHRPYKGKYIGKSLTTGNIETFENKTYGKGGWNIPDVKFWLDCNIDSIFKK